MKLLATALFALIALATTAHAKVETWTDLDGRKMEAEFVSASDTYVSFRKPDGGRYIFPFEKLSADDQARVRELSGKTLASSSASSGGTNASAPASAPASKPAQASTAPAGKFTQEVTGKLVSLKGNTLAPFTSPNLAGTKYYALYYSAQWCPPCRAFTPELVKTYSELKAKHADFELVFVSSDRDAEDMKTYMADYKMPWPALRHNFAKSLPAVTRHAGRGIPHLVFITADGEVLSTSYVDGKYVGPKKVLADIRKTLASKS